MNRLSEIAHAAKPGTGVQFRREAYGDIAVRHFLRDVLAMANATIAGNRYILTGIEFGQGKEKAVVGVDRADFSGKPPYRTLVLDYIEPPIQIAYHAVKIADKRVGIYEIGDCQDKPYMMRVDYSERLRRGDAYMRVDKSALKVGRRALLQMFAQRTQSAVPEDSIEIGFPGEVMQKKLSVPTVDLRRLPSSLEHEKLSELASVRGDTKNSGATTTMARLTHMRLFGSDMPYEDRSETGILEEIEHIDQKLRIEDQKFLFEDNALKLQLSILHQGDMPLENASLALALPHHSALHIAETLPAQTINGESDQQSALISSAYPAVSFQDDRVHVSANVGKIPAGVPVNAFEIPLRLCIGADLAGKQMTLSYKLFASNLSQDIQGKLAVVFAVPAPHQFRDF